MLEAEADGLAALAATGTVRVPAVAACASDATFDCALLAMEWLPLDPRPRRDLGERLGGALAALHLAAPAAGDGRFGWTRDNWLGATPQPNGWSAVGGLAGWIDFVSDARLGALAERLAAVGAPAALTAAMQRVVEALPERDRRAPLRRGAGATAHVSATMRRWMSSPRSPPTPRPRR